MADLSDGFIALPGGFGTIEEFFEALTWAQLGLHRKPCGLLNINGYFDPLSTFIDSAAAQKFIDQKSRSLVLISDTPNMLLKKLEYYEIE